MQMDLNQLWNMPVIKTKNFRCGMKIKLHYYLMYKTGLKKLLQTNYQS